MCLRRLIQFAMVCLWAVAGQAMAQSGVLSQTPAPPASQAPAILSLSPVLVDVSAPAQSSTVRVYNDADRPVTLQVRVFRWTQQDGQDVLEPTADVVGSPPFVTLEPGIENLIRVVRIATAPLQGEESYRLVIDQLPDPEDATGGVGFILRFSIPVFFSATNAPAAAPVWSVVPTEGGYVVTVQNEGGRRLQVSNLTLASDSGTPLAEQAGLVGYVLPRSEVSWFVPDVAEGLTVLTNVATLSVTHEAGRLDATVSISQD